MLQIFKRRNEQYQFFSTIYYTICSSCLELHGKILADLEPHLTPPLHDGCDCSLLQIHNRSELKYHKELGKKMESRARHELVRRNLFHDAIKVLPSNRLNAFEMFQEAGFHEFYVEELEDYLYSTHVPIEEDPEFTRKLFKLFINLNRFHYDKDRYAHVPTRMKAVRIENGERIIRSIFQMDDAQTQLKFP